MGGIFNLLVLINFEFTSTLSFSYGWTRFGLQVTDPVSAAQTETANGFMDL